MRVPRLYTTDSDGKSLALSSGHRARDSARKTPVWPALANRAVVVVWVCFTFPTGRGKEKFLCFIKKP